MAAPLAAERTQVSRCAADFGVVDLGAIHPSANQERLVRRSQISLRRMNQGVNSAL